MTSTKTKGMAAWQMADGDETLTVAPADIPIAAPHEIVIETRASAVNPVDWVMQSMGRKAFGYLTCPTIFGFDVAGTVHAVGDRVTRFKVGDRVLGLSCREEGGPHSHKYRGAGYSSHAFVAERLAAPIPPEMAFHDAAVLPMGVCVAATGLFQDDYLQLQLPTIPAKRREEWLLITAGASSIGACAIQLATSAGYNVVTTSSPGNFGFVRSLGAAYTIDYHRPQQEQCDELVAFLSDKSLAGALSIGSITDQTSTVESLCADVVARTPKPHSVKRKFVAFVSRVPQKLSEEIEHKFVWGTSLEYSSIGPAIFEDFLPKALATGQIRPLPQALVVGHGLDAIQSALDRQREGVSARKVVVTL